LKIAVDHQKPELKQPIKEAEKLFETIQQHAESRKKELGY
jgi:hypothetical protein